MSKHNYSQYSKKNNEIVEEEVATVVEEVATVIEPETIEAPAAEAIEVGATVVEPKPKANKSKTKKTEVVKPETVEGVVVKCAKLNVRAKPEAGADVVCVLDAASEIEININKSTDDWFSICTATGVEGYCMRKFVDARL